MTTVDRTLTAAQDIGGVTLEHPDGWAIQVRIRGTDSGPGLSGGDIEIDEQGEPWLVDREAWDEAHPGVEPTAEALGREAGRADSWMHDEACDAVDRARGWL